jgi:dUTP pyrophosphatase
VQKITTKKIQVMSNNILFYEKHLKEAIDPFRATLHSAGIDLFSPINLTINPRDTVVVDSGIKVKLPPNCYGRLCGRSGNRLDGIEIFDGVIDSDFFGTVKIIVRNTNRYTDLEITQGERIAQLICQPFILPQIAEVDNILETTNFRIRDQIPSERGEKGLGSTGYF